MSRKDGRLVKTADPMHMIMPLLWKGRTKNEAYITERIDLTQLNKYIDDKNKKLREDMGFASVEEAAQSKLYFKYTIFHAIVAAILKVLILRPRMNYFIKNGRMYERNKRSAAFMVKKRFSDESEEGLAVLNGSEEDNMDSIYEKLHQQVFSCRSDKKDGTSEAMDIICRLPFCLVRFIVWIVLKLDLTGRVPKGLIATDPYHRSVILSNLGSIKLVSGYHHLSDWGTNSLFVSVGEKKFRPFFNMDGTFQMKDSVDLGITVDERIADGYYYSKSVKLLKHILEHPEVLDRPLGEEVDY